MSVTDRCATHWGAATNPQPYRTSWSPQQQGRGTPAGRPASLRSRTHTQGASPPGLQETRGSMMHSWWGVIQEPEDRLARLLMYTPQSILIIHPLHMPALSTPTTRRLNRSITWQDCSIYTYIVLFMTIFHCIFMKDRWIQMTVCFGEMQDFVWEDWIRCWRQHSPS